jgi:DNA-binding MarR family transcriptional regulator
MSRNAMSGNGRVSPERLEAWRSFLRTHAAVVAALGAELEAERDLPLPWYDVLVSLSEAGGQLRMQDLADRVLFSRSGLTRLVDRMVATGLVSRERCEDDRRGTFAVLTAAGARRLREASGIHLRGIHDHFTRHLSDAEVRALRSALDKVLTAEALAAEAGAGTAASGAGPA